MLNPGKFQANWDGWLLCDNAQSEFMFNTQPPSMIPMCSLPLFCFCIIPHMGTTVMISKLHSEWIQCLESGEL